MSIMSSTESEIDWERVRGLYAFTRARAIERILVADPTEGGESRGRRDLRVLETMYTEARRSEDVAACAILYFRAQAMRDAQHPEFLGAWIIATHRDRRVS